MPTHIVNTREAKSKLSQLLREVADGVDVIVARNGEPVAKIIPWPPGAPTRMPGAWKGRVHYGTDDLFRFRAGAVLGRDTRSRYSIAILDRDTRSARMSGVI